MKATPYSPQRALRRFGFKQTLRAALIIGVIAGFMQVAQGIAYQKSYPDQVSQEKFAASLTSAPALGLLYGETQNLDAGAEGYMVYRTVGFMALITSIWGLLATTRILRASEEDGRWEVIRTGAVTARSASKNVMVGFLYSWLLSFTISTGLMAMIIATSDLSLAFITTVVINLLVFLPALLFGAAGLLTSQLGLTRHRALMYGLVPLLVFYLLRGIANTQADFRWLMIFSPFGWVDLTSPIIDPRYWWLAPFAIFTALFAALGLILAQRDLGSSVIKQSDVARSRFYLLGSSWKLALRQNIWMYVSWTTIAVVIAALMASLSGIAADATADSKSLSDSFNAVAGTNDIKIAFLGAGFIFLVMILMIMITTVIGSIRSDEAKQYLDNILVQPRRRTAWLTHRLLLGFAIAILISVATGLITYLIGSSQDIALEFGKVLATSITLIGTIGFLLGLGTLLYGLTPRIVTPLMYLVIGWSFLIILLSSVVKLNSIIQHSSLFHYASFNLAAWPNWATFGWLIGLGLIMAILGVVAFAKRDIAIE